MSCSLPDTDECLGTPCQQRCKNSIGSYRCSCRTGFHLHGNRHSCVGKGRDPVVFIFRLPIRKTHRVSPGTGKGQQSGPPWFPGACNRLSLCQSLPCPGVGVAPDGRPCLGLFLATCHFHPVMFLFHPLPDTPQGFLSAHPFSWLPLLPLVNKARYVLVPLV